MPSSLAGVVLLSPQSANKQRVASEVRRGIPMETSVHQVHSHLQDSQVVVFLSFLFFLIVLCLRELEA